LRVKSSLRFNFPLPSAIAPDETTITSLFLLRSQTISDTAFFKTDLFTPPFLFVRRDEPILTTNLLLLLNELLLFKYSPIPINNLNQKTNYYSNLDIGFGGLELSDRYTATICYPTPEDCTSYNNQLFGQDAHNMATGDFNGDGFEDLVVMWAIFPHTIEESQKVFAPIHIYLNDGNGNLYEDLNIFKNSEYIVHPFAYRLAIEDFNSDGIDDIFAGSMGKQVRGEDQSQDYNAPYPHLLLLSNQNGYFEDKSSNIDYQNNGEGPSCAFAHDASSGDFDNDNDMDIYACNIILVNNGLGEFTIHPYIGNSWHINNMSPMSSLLSDLNNDGYDDILFWNFDNRFLFETKPEEGTILLSNNSSEVELWQELELPKGPFPINRNKYNHAASGDLNGDGFNDVVVSITRDDPFHCSIIVITRSLTINRMFKI